MNRRSRVRRRRQRGIIRTIAAAVSALALVGIQSPPVHAEDPEPAAPCEVGSGFRCGYIDIPARGPDAPAVSLSYNVRLPYTVLKEATRTTPEVREEWSGPFPTALGYQGYGTSYKNNAGNLGRDLSAAGYAVLLVTVRGAACSSGAFDPFHRREAEDAKHVIDEWIPRQSWSNGDVAMVGASYPAITQLPVAAQRPRHLRAIVPLMPASDIYRDAAYPGGILNTGATSYFTAYQGASSQSNVAGKIEFEATEQQHTTCAQHQQGRALSPTTSPAVAFPREPMYTDFWKDRTAIADASSIDVPILLMTGWQDQVVGSRAVESLAGAKKLHAVLFNGGHLNLDHTGFTIETLVERERAVGEVLKFLDHYVKRTDNGYNLQPRIQIWWETGRDQTLEPAWVTTQNQWPAPQLKTQRLHLSGNGSLVDDPSLVTAGSDSYSHAPGTGSSSLGIRSTQPTGTWSIPPAPGAALTYTTAALSKDLVALGPASVDLWLASTAPDTDLQVTLSEIFVQGGKRQEMFVQQGWLRASHRTLDPARSRDVMPYHSHTHRVNLNPGEVVPVRIEVLPFAHVFRQGSQLRLTIQSPKAIADLWSFAPQPPAVNQIVHDAARPSALVLGLLPGQSDTIPRQPAPCGSLHSQPCRPAVG